VTPGRGQFWPQGHNFNKFGRGPLDDVIYQNMKALGLVVSDKKIFGNCILKIAFWKPTFWPSDLHMQPSGTVWTTLVEEHPGIIPVKFGQNPISGFRGEDVQGKKFTHDGRRTNAGHNSSPWALCAQVS